MDAVPKRGSPRIETSGLRVEFDGEGPSRLVVPIVFPAGNHRNLRLRIRPRPGVALRNAVDVGDAFCTTFTRSHTTTAGGSFFATASHGRSYGRSDKPYDVVHLEDLRGVRFSLPRFDVEDEPLAIQLAFPIRTCGTNSADDYFAEIVLEVDGAVVQTERLRREVHPGAGKVLLVSGYSAEHDRHLFRSSPLGSPAISGLRRPYVEISEVHRPALSDMRSLATGYDGAHIYTNVGGGNVLIGDRTIGADAFFAELNGLGLKFIFIATCNSVDVVSSFRETDMRALVAASENLYVHYAEEFEEFFYKSLGEGAFISTAFANAAVYARREGAWIQTRSGRYHPMFLDLKADFCFGPPRRRSAKGGGNEDEDANRSAR